MKGDGTDERPPPQPRPEAVGDPFVHLMDLLVELNGSRRFVGDDGQLVVSVKTVNRYRKGEYPKTRLQDQVGDIDRWARARFPRRYPPPGWPGGLTYYSGRTRPALPPPKIGVDAESAPAWAEPAPSPEPAAPAEPIDDATEITAEPPADDSPSVRAEAVQPVGPLSLTRDDNPAPFRSVLEPHRHPRRLRRRYAAAGIVAAGGFVALIVALRPHHNSASHNSTVYSRNDATIVVRNCPATTCAETDTLQTGAQVQMICYRDAQRANLNYSSTRWFDVRDEARGITGWVHSSQVANQTKVGLC